MQKIGRVGALSVTGLVLFALVGCQSSGQSASEANAPLKNPKDCVTKIALPAAPKEGPDAVKPDEQGPVPTVTAGTNFGEKPTIAPGEGPQSTQFTRKILIAGTGPQVTPDVDVAVNYLGQLWDGTVFDNSYDRHEPSSFNLNRVIKGWKWGLNGAHVGDRIELVIPEELAYNDPQSRPDSIPAGSTLVFVVDVLFAPPTLTESEMAGFTELLSKSKPTGEKLPAGLRIYCKPGHEPQLAFEANSKVPSEPTVVWTLAGQGRQITENDVIGVVGVSGSWGDRPVSSWTNGAGLSFYRAKDVGAVGKNVGSRMVMTGPPNKMVPRALVNVVDVVSAYDISGAQP